MTRKNLKSVLGGVTAALMLGTIAAPCWAADPFGEAELFFELNNSDGDLGIHSAVDGEPWKKLRITSPGNKKLLDIKASSKLRLQGLTQLSFESAEPNFEEQSPEAFFNRFPPGIYEISGTTTDGVDLESPVELSQVMAAPVGNVTVNGQAVPEDCDEGPVPVVSAPVLVDWDPVTTSHPDIGAIGPVDIELYEFFIETDEVKLSAIMPPDVTQFDIPDGYLALSSEWKLEILVRTDTHNNTSIETCFLVN